MGAMMTTLQKSHKDMLHDFYKQSGIEKTPFFLPPIHSRVKGEARVFCLLVCPRFHVPRQPFLKSYYPAESTTQEEAEQMASAMALDDLVKQGFISSWPYPPPQATSGRARVNHDEVSQLRNRLSELLAQLTAHDFERQECARVRDQEPTEEVDVEALSPEDSKLRLKKEVAKNKRREEEQAVMEALLKEVISLMEELQKANV